jgi:glycosyltransferase involved in cell wall biosynthesis
MTPSLRPTALVVVPEVEIRSVKVCETLSALGFEIVFVTDKHRLSNWDDRLGAIPHLIHVRGSLDRLPGQLLWHPLRSRALRRAIEGRNVTLAYARDIFIGHWLLKHRAAHLQRGGSLPPIIVDVADDFVSVLESSGSALRRAYATLVNPKAIEAQVLKLATHVLFVSDTSQRHFERRHGVDLAARASVVPNSPIGSLSRESPPPLHRRPGQVLYVGTIDQGIRDFDTVLGADPHLDRDISIDCFTFRPDANSYVADLQRRAQELKHLRIRFAEAVSFAEYGALLENYRVGLIPHVRSQVTDFTVPNKLYDYVDRGLEVVASDNPAIVDEVRRLGRGDLYSGGNAQSLARTLQLALNRAGGMEAVPRSDAVREDFAAAFGAVVRSVTDGMAVRSTNAAAGAQPGRLQRG